MASEQLTTPYAEATELKSAGADSETIATRLRGRGLDEEAIALLLNAIGAAPVRPLPVSAPVEVAAVAVAAPPPALGPPTSTVCARCGVFLEAAWVPVLGKAYCTACGSRPEVNYPRAFRDAHWGKRDALTWFMGITGLLGLMIGSIALINEALFALPMIVGGIGSILFWSGAKIGRVALVGTTLITVLMSVVAFQFPNVFGIGLTIAAMRSVRTKLFFELDVSEAELDAAWRATNDNLPAAYSCALGGIALATMLTWIARIWQFGVTTALLGALAVFIGIIGLRNVNPNAQPPVGRKGAAMVGVVTGSLAIVAAAFFLALPYL